MTTNEVDSTEVGTVASTPWIFDLSTVGATKTYRNFESIYTNDDNITFVGSGDINATLELYEGGTIKVGDTNTSSATGLLKVKGLLLDPSNGTVGTGSSKIIFDLSGTTAGSGYDQVEVNGTVTLTNSELNVTLLDGFSASVDQNFTLINNDDSDAITGTFNDINEGDDINISGNIFNVSYTGGDGNDVVLTLLTLSNSVPTDINLTSYFIAENSPIGSIIGTLGVADADSEDIHTYSFCGVDNNFSISDTNLSTAIALDYETKTTYTTCIRVTDSSDAIFDKNITINITNVDEAPVFGTISNVTQSEDFTDLNITLNANDEDGDTITYTVTSSNPSIATVSIVDGKIVVTPIENAYGTFTVELNATANGQSVLQDFNITIDPVNDAPTFSTNLSDIAIDEDSGVYNFELNATDVEGDDLNITISLSDYTIVSLAQSWEKDEWLNLASYSQPLDFNLTTLQDANGEVDITITVQDSQGASSTDMFTITVNPVNDAPTLASMSDVIVYKNFADFNYTMPPTDVDGDTLEYNVTATDTSLVTLEVTNNIVTLKSIEDKSGITDVNITVSDSEYSVSKLFTLKILSLQTTDDINTSSATITADENKTVVRFEDDNITVTAPTKPDANGSISHEISLGDKKVVATSDINGSVVNITDNGVQTTYENNITNLKAEVNATITGEASHVLDINGTRVEARSDFVGATTIIKKDENGSVEIETSVEVDSNTTVKVVAKQDGSATHTVTKGTLESKATSKVKGAKTVIDTSGNVNTSVDTNKTGIAAGKQFEAVAVTDANGETVTKFRLINTSTNAEENPEPTLATGEKFPAGSDVEIKEDENDNTVIHIQTTTPTLTNPTVFNIK